MCGIVGAIGQRNVSGILVEGLKRLEYRGYDSAGLALITRKDKTLACVKAVGKVKSLEDKIIKLRLTGLLVLRIRAGQLMANLPKKTLTRIYHTTVSH